MGGDFFYYDPCVFRKVCVQTALSRVAARRVVSDDVPHGWVHVNDENPRVPLDASFDFVPVWVGARNSQGTSGWDKRNQFHEICHLGAME